MGAVGAASGRRTTCGWRPRLRESECQCNDTAGGTLNCSLPTHVSAEAEAEAAAAAASTGGNGKVAAAAAYAGSNGDDHGSDAMWTK